MVTLIAEWQCSSCDAEGIGGMESMEKAMNRHQKQTQHPCVMSAVPISSEEGQSREARATRAEGLIPPG